MSFVVADIGELEAAKLQHVSQIRDLESQLNRAQERINKLESVKRTLESRKDAESAEVSTQLHKLQVVCV